MSRVRIFRDLMFGKPVLEIGRLRIWIAGRSGNPSFYRYRAYGNWHVGILFIRAMLFGRVHQRNG